METSPSPRPEHSTSAQSRAKRRAGHDSYTPSPPDVARCPHCGHTLPGMPADFRHVECISLWRLTCPACGGQWNENRDAAQVQRFWTPVPAAGASR